MYNRGSLETVVVFYDAKYGGKYQVGEIGLGRGRRDALLPGLVFAVLIAVTLISLFDACARGRSFVGASPCHEAQEFLLRPVV